MAKLSVHATIKLMDSLPKVAGRDQTPILNINAHVHCTKYMYVNIVQCFNATLYKNVCCSVNTPVASIIYHKE